MRQQMSRSELRERAGPPRLAYLLKDLPLQVLARTRSDRVLRRRGSLTPGAGRPGTVASSSSDGPTPGAPRTPKTSPTHALQHRSGPVLGPAPPQAHPPLVLGRGRRHPPHHPRGGDPSGHRASAQRSHPEAGLAVVVGHQRGRSGHRPALAGIPATLRHRAHLPPLQADPRLNLSEDPHPRSGRRLDLADPRRLHPTAIGPAPGSRPAPPGERPISSGRLTPGRVRRDFRHIRAKAICPAQAPKPTHPRPGPPAERTPGPPHATTSTHPARRAPPRPGPRNRPTHGPAAQG